MNWNIINKLIWLIGAVAVLASLVIGIATIVANKDTSIEEYKACCQQCKELVRKVQE